MISAENRKYETNPPLHLTHTFYNPLCNNQTNPPAGGFTTAASGAPQDSLDALRTASDTSYYKGKDSLWVKVVSNSDSGTGAPGGGTSLQVSRFPESPPASGERSAQNQVQNPG